MLATTQKKGGRAADNKLLGWNARGFLFQRHSRHSKRFLKRTPRDSSMKGGEREKGVAAE